MGVTMVGIHERKGRANIASHNVARKIDLFFKFLNSKYFYKIF